MNNIKPIYKHGATVTDSNFDDILFTEKQAVNYIKKFVSKLNRDLKRVNVINFRYKFVGVKDCGSYWGYTIV